MELRRYFLLLLHRWWLILLVTIIAGGAVLLISLNTTPIYRATAHLMVSEAAGDESYANVLRIEKLKATYVELIAFQPVLQRTSKQLENENIYISAENLAGQVQAASQIDTQLMTISIIDTDPERAARIGNILSEEFIQYLAEQEGSRFEEVLGLFDAEREAVGAEIQQIETQINELNDSTAPDGNLSPEQAAQMSSLQLQLNEQQNIYNKLFNDAQDIRIQSSTSTNYVVIANEAKATTRPISPRTTSNMILAIIAGILISVGLILLLDYLNDTVRTPDQLRDLIGRPALGVIPYIKDNQDRSQTLITHVKPRDPTSEAFRILRTNIEYMSVDEPLRSLLVTSPSPSEGKSTTIANLATVLAQSGHQVLLIDADLRKPSQHKIFDSTNNSQGLTTALLDNESPLKYHIQDTQVRGLQIMTSGPLPPNPAELLGSKRMEQILDELKEQFDIVLIDTPPALTVADASILTTKTNGALVVTRIGQTREDAIERTIHTLESTKSKLFGVVLNRATSRDGGSYYYYYRYYTYEYGDQKRRTNPNGRRWIPQWLTSLLG